MSNTKHTPGPWSKSLSKTRFNIHAPSFLRLATAWIRPEGGSLDEIEANARLIAAAPELLEALEAVLRFDANMPGEYKHDVTLAIKVRKAISKATNATL
jgi:hypothetical protein